MATVSLVPGTSSVAVNVRAKATVDPQQVLEAPGGLYPMRASAWEVDEYRIQDGWPVPVPSFDIRVPTLVSGDGGILTNREDAAEVMTDAILRWIADPLYFDETALYWAPVQGDRPNWEFAVDTAPVLLNDYSYRVGDERFNDYTVLNFDSDTRNHMWIDLNGVLGGSAGYTVIMVLSPNSAFGNDVTVPYNGLWCYGQATGVGDTFSEPLPANYASFTIQGHYIYMETDAEPRKIGVSIADQLNASAPSYLALVVQRPVTTMYSATGPSKLLSKSLPAGSSQPALSGRVVLGRSTGDVLHTADMALFEIGIYADALNAGQVRNEFAKLSRIYGGDT